MNETSVKPLTKVTGLLIGAFLLLMSLQPAWADQPL